MTTQVSTRDFFQQGSVQVKFKELLGKRATQFITSVLQVASSNSLLSKASKESIYGAAVTAAVLDLPIQNNLGFAYIVPFGNQASFQLGYKGLIQLALRSGQFKNISVTEIYEGQIVSENPLKGYEFDFSKKESDKIIGYAAYFSLINGFEKTEYMSKEKLESHGKKYSQTYKKGFGVWKDDFDSMAKKGLALDTVIPTPDGFKTMGELNIGDTVYNALGEETKVIAKSEIKNIPCYEVKFRNGDTIVCDHEHRWFVKGTTGRLDEWQVLETKDLFGVKNLGYPIVIPITEPVKMSEKELIIDPYILGYWLGNGSQKAAVVCCSNKDSDEISVKFEKFYNVHRRDDNRSNATILGISSKTGLRSDGTSLKHQLKKVGVYGNKHIPMIYKRSSIEQRIEIIRGLCDSDGCIDLDRGRVKYGSVLQELADDFYEILSSLGEKPTHISKIARGYGTTTTYFEIEWKPRGFNPFHLKRKADRLQNRLVITNNSINSIRKVDSVPTQCIAVDSGDAEFENDLKKSFLVGYGFYPTHNTVLKLTLSKYAPLSVEMQKAITFDQGVTTDGETVDYPDNEPESFATEYTDEDMQSTFEEVKDDPKKAKEAFVKGEINEDLFNQCAK